ncbi:MAG: BatA domain-containing protein [Chitinophagales bacterium]
MSFLFPGFLFALFTLAIPIIIHLFQFRRFKTVYFTNVKFLRNIQEETATRNRLKHLLVLISRLLALAFLIFAFAQPFLKSSQQAQQTANNTLSIYIDNSFSMEAQEDGKQLLEIAKTKAEEIVNVFKVDDAFQLLTNDFEARHQRLVNKEEMLDLIRSVQVSPSVRTLTEVTNRQKDILLQAPENQKNIYLLSDFQKNSSDFENDTLYNYTLIPLKGNEERNLAIDSVWFTTPVQMPGQQSQLCFTITNFGEEDIEDASVQLKITSVQTNIEQTKGIATVSVTAKNSVTDTLQFTISETDEQQCQLMITDYPITFDDVFYFTFQPVQKIPVLVINGKNENSFINSVYNNPLFFYQQYPASQINYNSFDQFNFIILNELLNISSGLAEVLTKKINEGVVVLLVPSVEQDNVSINSFLSSNRSGIFGELLSSKRNTTSLNTRAEVFSEVFEELPKNLSMPTAEKSYPIRTSSKTAEEIVLQFSDGTPMLAKYTNGSGALYLSAVPFDRTITDLPVQGGIFVPFLYRLALLSMENLPLFVTIGQEQWVSIGNNALLSNEQTVTVINKNTEFIPAMRKKGSRNEIDVSRYAKDAGIYVVSGNSINQSIAMNYDRRESNLTFYSAGELLGKFPEKNISIIDDPQKNLSNTVAEMQQGKPLWKYCVIFALLFLALEIAIIRFMP